LNILSVQCIAIFFQPFFYKYFQSKKNELQTGQEIGMMKNNENPKKRNTAGDILFHCHFYGVADLCRVTIGLLWK
jgi:hypothetical protein